MSAGPDDEISYATDWPARARVEPEPGWQRCRVVAIAGIGATLELGREPDEGLLGRIVHVRVQTRTSIEALHLVGQVADQAHAPHVGTRVTMRFEGPPLDRSVLVELLLHLRGG